MFSEFAETSTVDHNFVSWRKKVCDSVFYFFSLFGLFAYIPSTYLALKDELWSILIANTIVYLACVFMTFFKKISYIIKSSLGSMLFYLLGLILMLQLGPQSAGGIWLFASTIITALLLGNKGALIAFIVNLITQVVLFYLIKENMLPWQENNSITLIIWFIKAISFVVLNFVVVIVNNIYMKGFINILTEMTRTRNATIIGLAKLAEHRDNETGEHLQRLQNYSVMLGKQLQKKSQYKSYISNEYLKDLFISSQLHDIGKVGIKDAILLKEGPLTSEEFEEVKQHPSIGFDVIKEIEEHIHGESLYTMGREIALYHHEKWDGTGYPAGMKGLEIPLSARIVALVDVYDALTSKRPYKEAFPHEKAISIIKENRGSHFDPDIVDSFLDIEKEFNIS